MPSTPNLNIPHMGASDTGKYAEVNTAILDFDSAYNGWVDVQINPSLVTDFDAVFLQYMVFILSGFSETAVTISLPAHARPFIVINQTGQSVTFQVGTNTNTVTISNSKLHFLYSDGVGNVYEAR